MAPHVHTRAHTHRQTWAYAVLKALQCNQGKAVVQYPLVTSRRPGVRDPFRKPILSGRQNLPVLFCSCSRSVCWRRRQNADNTHIALSYESLHTPNLCKLTLSAGWTELWGGAGWSAPTVDAWGVGAETESGHGGKFGIRTPSVVEAAVSPATLPPRRRGEGALVGRASGEICLWGVGVGGLGWGGGWVNYFSSRRVQAHSSVPQDDFHEARHVGFFGVVRSEEGVLLWGEGQNESVTNGRGCNLTEQQGSGGSGRVWRQTKALRTAFYADIRPILASSGLGNRLKRSERNQFLMWSNLRRRSRLVHISENPAVCSQISPFWGTWRLTPDSCCCFGLHEPTTPAAALLLSVFLSSPGLLHCCLLHFNSSSSNVYQRFGKTFNNWCLWLFYDIYLVYFLSFSAILVI